MKDTVFDRILTSSPLGRTAAVVTSESRDNFVSTKKILQRHSDVPFKMRAPRPVERNSATFEDLTGRQFGRFRVIGIFDREGAPHGKNGPALWVCRCVCGRFQTRTAKAVRNPANAADSCDECQQLKFIRDRERKKALGVIKCETIESAVARLKSGEAT